MAQKLAPQANSLYGTPSPLNKQALPPVVAQRAPTTADTGYKLGQLWVYAGNAIYALEQVAGGVATWVAIGGGAVDVQTINTLPPTAGNITIAGTANQVTVSNAGSTVTLSLPSSLIVGDVTLNPAGSKLSVQGGAVTDFIGQTTLVAGTVTVANTNITAADKVFVTRHGINGSTALGVFDISITPATSFTITALKTADATTETNDVSIVDYFIVRQI